MRVPSIARLAAILKFYTDGFADLFHVRNHLGHPRLSEFTFVACHFVFCFFCGGVEIEGMPCDAKFGVWMRFLVVCDRFLQATFADEAPGTDLSLVAPTLG